MTISDANMIDAVACRADTDIVRLLITDHLDWYDVEAHCHLIRRKISTYVVFVESGQLAQLPEPRMPAIPAIVFALVCAHSPPIEALRVLDQVRSALHSKGITLSIESACGGRREPPDDHRGGPPDALDVTPR